MSVLRVYDPEVDVFTHDGYPMPWSNGSPRIPDLVREQAGNRCVRCQHPYERGAGEWSPCDERCTHDGPCRWVHDGVAYEISGPATLTASGLAWPTTLQARWRILTVHHLNGVKGDCRWWNLAALCQRCHLVIQGRVQMERVYVFEHSPWFKPYAAGWYASAYLGEDLSRAEVDERLDELLALELAA